MSATPEAPNDPAKATPVSNDTQNAGPSKPGDGKALEKTISCVSCRKRKLKCDRVKPKCGTCTRLRHDCEYPERRRTLGSKRRNMKELEARLAQVETQLVSEQKKAGSKGPSVAEVAIETDWDAIEMEMNLDMDDPDLLDQCFDIPQLGMDAGMSSLGPEFFSQELLGLGLQEPLPPQDMMNELYTIYFEKFHPTMPFMHKPRFYTSLDRAPNMRPPVCLRYAMWTMAASLSEKYAPWEDLLYQRARKYIEAQEMKGHGEAFVSIYHAQTWGIIAGFEAKKTYFSRSWMSSGRMVRLVHMLGLDRVDSTSLGMKTILPPPSDAIEVEERRRTFWGAFYCDRWSSSGTGWPMIIDEQSIKTNLPCSEYAFEHGIIEPAICLSEALTPAGGPKLSPFSGVLVSATLFGHNFQHLHNSGSEQNPDDLQNGEFWKRHRRMDNVLSNTFMFLPDQLRLPSGLRDMNVVFLHLNIHTSAICLHQAAVATASRYNLDQNFINQSQTRCLMAADEITNVMKLTCHVDPTNMHSWIGFCLYVAAGIYVKNQASGQPYPPSLQNLEFLLTAMRAIGRKQSITKHFIAQLELDIEAAGFTKLKDKFSMSQQGVSQQYSGKRQGRGIIVENMQGQSTTTGERGSNDSHRPMPGILAEQHGQSNTFDGLQNHSSPVERGPKYPNTPMNGLLVDRDGQGFTFEELQSYATNPSSSSSEHAPIPISTLTPASDIMTNESRITSASESPNPVAVNANWDSARNLVLIPDNYFPGAKTLTQWSSSGDPGSQINQVTNPAQIGPFIEGPNTTQVSSDKATTPSEEFLSSESPALCFPYRHAVPPDQSSTTKVGVCPWDDANPAAPGPPSVADWAQLSNFDDTFQLQAGGSQFGDIYGDGIWPSSTGN